MGDRQPSRSLLPWFGMAVAILATIGAAFALIRIAPTGPPPSAQAAPDERRAPREEGVIATVTAGDLAAERRLPAAALALEPGQTLDARLPPGAFVARIDVTFHPGRVRRAAVGADVSGGMLTIEESGQTIAVIDATDGPTRVMSDRRFFPDRLATITYRLHAGDAAPVRLRALWRPQESTAALPLPAPGAGWTADPGVTGLSVIRQLRCAACHPSADPTLQAVVAPDPAPVLGAVGARARPAWMGDWIADPASLKPGAAMPALLGHGADLDAGTVEDLVHFLAGLGGPITGAPDPGEDLVATGEAIYHQVGCFACHGALDGDEPPDPHGTEPLGDLAAKTTPAALASFLLDPVAVRPSGRMPSQRLTELESQAIAAYLVSITAGERPGSTAGFTVDPARAGRGREAFAARGCAACHEMGAGLPAIASTLAALGLESIAASTGGCLSAAPGPGVPDFDLSVHQRDALIQFLSGLDERRSADVPLDRLGATLLGLDCLACHRYHGTGGPPAALDGYFSTAIDVDMGDEGRLPPELTDAGARLTQRWMTAVLEEQATARPHMAARMPQFGSAAVDELPALFAAASGAGRDPDDGPEPTTQAAMIGRELTGSGGFNCIQCHSIAGRDATGTPGPDLVAMPERLRYGYFETWLSDPKLMRPGTRMPTFFYEGRSGLVDYLDGDAVAQIAAIWAYLSQGEHLPLPDGLPDPGQLLLSADERPIVFRTFMENVGARAMACGFPEQVHCAFDAETCSLRLVWTGRFLSAAGAWAARGGTETNPDQPPVWVAPDGHVPLAIAGGSTARFRGYRLDQGGRPAFLYALEGPGATVEVVERPAPAGAAALERIFELTGPPGTRVEVALPDHEIVEGDAPGGTVTIGPGGSASLTMELAW